MSLKSQNNMLAAFSMASMTDVIFLLLVFFMVTSTFIFPTALDINLPEGSQQQPLKPSTQVYVDAQGQTYVSWRDSEPLAVVPDSIAMYLRGISLQDSTMTVAVYADTDVPYGRVVDVLNAGAEVSVKMVLATNPVRRDLAPGVEVNFDTDFDTGFDSPTTSPDE